MKVLKNFIILVALLSLASCYEEKEWIDENVDFQNKAVPAVFLNPLDSSTYTVGGSVRLNLEFFCKDPLKEIRIYESLGTNATSGARTLVKTVPYAPAFNAVRQQDTLVTPYPISATVAKGTRIWLHAEAVSQQDVAKGTWVTTTSSSRSFTTK